MSAATVDGIYVARAAGEPVQPLLRAELAAGAGVKGDRYAARQGYWSDPRWPDQELTLIEAELEEAMSVAPGGLRRNIVTRGIDLRTLTGRRFAIGTALLEGVRPCDPCMHLEELTRPGLFQELAGRGGLRARIVRGGEVAVGDAIRLSGE